MYKVVVSPRAQKELKKISYKHQTAIYQTLLDLKEDPLVGKPLTKELTGRLSYRIGVYRIIYKVNFKDKIVLILTAGHRSIVY